jgi:predicted PurR-regulated permease PerM
MKVALAIIAFVAALYGCAPSSCRYRSEILASYALHPVVDWLRVCRIQRPAGAALVLFVLAGGCRIAQSGR